jgi:hypothetical protein
MVKISRVALRLERLGRGSDTYAVVVEVTLDADENPPWGAEAQFVWTDEWAAEHLPHDHPIWESSAFDEARERYVAGILNWVAEEVSSGIGEAVAVSEIKAALVMELPTGPRP